MNTSVRIGIAALSLLVSGCAPSGTVDSDGQGGRQDNGQRGTSSGGGRVVPTQTPAPSPPETPTPPRWGYGIRLVPPSPPTPARSVPLTAEISDPFDHRVIIRYEVFDASGAPVHLFQIGIQNDTTQQWWRHVYGWQVDPSTPPGTYRVSLTLLDETRGFLLAAAPNAGTIQIAPSPTP